MRSARAAAALSAALAAVSAAAAVPVPALTGPVVDLAGAVDPDSADRLATIARSAWNGGRGPQLEVLVVRSLEGEPIEDFAMRVAEAWKVGTRGRDDGVLVVVAVEDRKARIEVGGGLEGSLTDARSARIVRNTLAPAFRAQRYGPGLVAAAEEVLAALGAPAAQGRMDVPPPEGAPRAAPPEAGDLPWILRVLPWALFGAPLAFFVLIAALAIVLGRRGLVGRRSAGAGWSFDSSASSYDSGSSFDSSSSSSDVGGGWSGGGGGFSGGGASGSW